MEIVLLILAIVIVLIVLYLILIGNIDKSEPEIVKLDKPVQFIGLEINTSDRSLGRHAEISLYVALKEG